MNEEGLDEVKRWLEEQKKREERLEESAEVTLQDLYEGIDFEAFTLCDPELMQTLMDEIDRDLIGWEYYHLVIYALSLYKVSREGHLKTPCKTIQEVSGQHMAEVASRAGLKWRQIESLLVGEGTAQNLWKLVVAFDWLGCQVPTLWCSYIVIRYVSELVSLHPAVLKARWQHLYRQLTTQ